jgi:hypothetical protein
MVRRSLMALVAGVASLGLVGVAQADDLFPPPWRGDPGSTFQHWTFDDDDNPAEPEFWDNPYGTATATMSGPMANWLGSDGFPREGLWGDLDAMDLWVPDHPEPLPYKDIWLQVTYMYVNLGVFQYRAPTVDIPGAEYLEGDDVFLEYNNPDFPELGEWRLQFSKWRIEPNPPEETIALTWPPFGGEWPRGVVDQVVVDTICIPEPAGLALLVLGGALLMVRRR